DYTIVDRPQVRVAFPAVEILAVEEVLGLGFPFAGRDDRGLFRRGLLCLGGGEARDQESEKNCDGAHRSGPETGRGHFWRRRSYHSSRRDARGRPRHSNQIKKVKAAKAAKAAKVFPISPPLSGQIRMNSGPSGTRVCLRRASQTTSQPIHGRTACTPPRAY